MRQFWVNMENISIHLFDSFYSKAFDSVRETKYLGVMLNSQLKTSIDVSRQTRKFYAQVNMLLRSFRYCSVDVKYMLFRPYCTNMYCCPLWFNSTSSSIKKLKTSYNGVLRRLLLVVKPYSASEMFVTHIIPSFYELLRKCIYSIRERRSISHSANKIIKACLSPIVFIHSPIRQFSNPTVEISIVFIVTHFFFSIVIMICI